MEYPSNLSEKDKFWFNLIHECRASGKIDHQWFEENNISVRRIMMVLLMTLRSIFLRRLELLIVTNCSIWGENSKNYPSKNKKRKD